MAPFLLSGDAMGLLWEKSLRVVFFGHGSVLRDWRQRALGNVGNVLSDKLRSAWRAGGKF